MRFKTRRQTGYTLIELMLVVAIMGLLTSATSPKIHIILQKANQSKSKANLANMRSALALYYSDNTHYPLVGYPQGIDHLSDGKSLTGTLVPRYLPKVPTPKFLENIGFNGLPMTFDSQAETHMAESPPHDSHIVWGPPDYTPMLSAPFAYDNNTGVIYYPNGNYDTSNRYFYEW